MIHKHFERHKYTIAVSVPVVALVASSLFFVRSSDEMCIVPADNRFVEVGERVTLELHARADAPINVISARVHVPTDTLSVASLSREDSMIDLWTEEPALSDGVVSFTGGTTRPGGFVGEGVVMKIIVVPLVPGSATVSIEETHMLAHDGIGTDIPCDQGPIVLSIRPTAHPSPDLNNDKQVNVLDFGILSGRLFLSYGREYDLNLDGRITIADIGMLLSTMVDSNKLGGFAGVFGRSA